MIDAVRAPDSLRALGAKLPASLHLGTSSWSFPGWQGLVYAAHASTDRLARFGLAAYSAHPLFRTVGLDRTFYQPMSREELAELAQFVPPGFRFLVKAHQALTRPDADDRGRTFGDTGALRSTGIANPLFLDPQYAIDRVVGPAVTGLRDACGPIVFQFPPLELDKLPEAATNAPGPAAFIDRVGDFLSRLPKGTLYAVEVRNRSIVSPEHAPRWNAMLAATGVANGYVVHPTMPPLADQARLIPLATQPALVIRWLLRLDQTYQAAKDRYEPFDRLIDPDPTSRSHILTMLSAALASAKAIYIIANNKAEGSAPLSLIKLAEELGISLQ